jgi:hypothetical protein
VPDVPEDVDRICQRALAVERTQRYSTALEMQEDIEQAIARLPQRASERDIGDLVSRLFAEERQAIAIIIERQLREFRASPGSGVTSAVLPTLGVDGMISVTPSRLRALEQSDATRLGPDQSTMRRRTAVLGASVFALLLALVLWVSFRSTNRSPATQPPVPVATVMALKPPAGTPTLHAAPPAQPAPTNPAPAQELAAEAPAPLAETSPTSTSSAGAKPVAIVKSRVRKHVPVAARRTSADSTKPVTTISAVSTFGPLDGRK